MIRVAQIIETVGRGGAERLLVDIARGIDRKRFAMSVYTLYRHPRTYAQALKDLGVVETCLDLRGRWRSSAELSLGSARCFDGTKRASYTRTYSSLTLSGD